MDENLHNIEDLFYSTLDDNEEIPSQNVWDAVDKRLDKDHIISIKRKYTILKRIAVLLLLLLSISLYKINTTHNNNGLAKNNTTGSENQKEPNKKTDKFLDKKNETNSAITIDTSNTDDNKKENVALNNLVDSKKELTNQQQVAPTNKHHLQKQNITEITNSEKDISKNQVALNATQKKKITTTPAYSIKIKNAKPTEDEQPFVQNNDKQVDDQIPSLRKLKNVSNENVKLQSKDSIDTKKLLQSLATSKTKVSDTSNNAAAKTVQKKQGVSSRFSLTPFFSPDVAWYRLQDDKVGNQQDNANEIEREEKHEFSSTFGALVDYKINDHWGLQSGVTLSNTNITVEPKTIYAQPDNTGNIKYRINTSSGYGYVLPSFSANPVIGDSLYAFTSTHSLQYIGIPLAVTYNVTKGKFKFNALAGVSANILTKAKLETTVEKGFNNSIETVNNLQGLKKVYFSGLAGVGVDYKLTNKTALSFAPTMRFALNSINKDATVKSYPMFLGFAIGLKIGL